MRVALLASLMFAIASPAAAEVWLVREGECGEWQSRWEVQQEQSGVWVGRIDHLQVGGPCMRATGETLRSEVRATIAGDNLFAVRMTGDLTCTHVARIREARGRGFVLCENDERRFFGIRFRASPQRPLREVPPDEELLFDERGTASRGSRGFRERGLDDWFAR